MLVILLWFVDPAIAEMALSQRGLIQEDGVEVLPERVTACCLDENVNLQLCRKYFTSDGWLAVQNVVEAIKKDPVWYCGRCTHPINVTGYWKTDHNVTLGQLHFIGPANSHTHALSMH